jgi:hypothetical protein
MKHGCITGIHRQNKNPCNGSTAKKGKLMATMFCDVEGILLIEYKRAFASLVRKMEKVNSLVRKIYLTIYYINNLLLT